MTAHGVFVLDVDGYLVERKRRVNVKNTHIISPHDLTRLTGVLSCSVCRTPPAAPCLVAQISKCQPKCSRGGCPRPRTAALLILILIVRQLWPAALICNERQVYTCMSTLHGRLTVRAVLIEQLFPHILLFSFQEKQEKQEKQEHFQSLEISQRAQNLGKKWVNMEIQKKMRKTKIWNLDSPSIRTALSQQASSRPSPRLSKPVS